MHPFLLSLLGGGLIGLSAALLLLANGRIAGVSGIVGGIWTPRTQEAPWQLTFLGGLVAGGLLLRHFFPATIGAPLLQSAALTLSAGMLVGFGTRLGSGCTSGHGICGLARGSVRSLTAVLVFMSAGVLTVFVARHLLGVLP
jgi:uncharacterized membrane protein YedE/YeeE